MILAERLPAAEHAAPQEQRYSLEYAQPRLSAQEPRVVIWERKTEPIRAESAAEADQKSAEFLRGGELFFGGNFYKRWLVRLVQLEPFGVVQQLPRNPALSDDYPYNDYMR